jgi:hypothetical protein
MLVEIDEEKAAEFGERGGNPLLDLQWREPFRTWIDENLNRRPRLRRIVTNRGTDQSKSTYYIEFFCDRDATLFKMWWF